MAVGAGEMHSAVRGPAALLCFPSAFTAMPEAQSMRPSMTVGPGTAPFFALSFSTPAAGSTLRFAMRSATGSGALLAVSHSKTLLSDPQDAIRLPLWPPWSSTSASRWESETAPVTHPLCPSNRYRH